MRSNLQAGLERLRRRLALASERETAAGLLGAIAFAGPGIGFVTFVLPHPEGANFLAPALAFAASIVAGTSLWLRRTKVGWPAIALVVALGSAVVTVTMLSVPDRTGAYASYYVWLGIFSFYFLRPSWALAQIVWIGGLYGVAVAVDSQPGAAEQWVNGVATTLGVGLLVLALRTRIDGLVRSLETAARTDELTGLPNRRAFDEQLQRELQRSARTGAPISLALVDLDGFKKLNDTAGHLAGDDALRRVGATIHESVRAMDWSARVGGDEFAVLLPEAEEGEARRIIERLRIAVAREFVEAEGLRASIGLATRMERELSARSLMERADHALYEAKRGGGDAVVGAAGSGADDETLSRAATT